MEVLILGAFRDKQTGVYIAETFRDLKWKVRGVDTRAIIESFGTINGQSRILQEIDEYAENPSLVLVMKGLEMTLETLKLVRDRFPQATFVNWFFDKYLQDKPIWDTEDYYETLQFFDYYFCSLKGVADKLNDLGFDNVHYLDEACYPALNGETYINHYQERKYGEDIAFVGSIGFFLQHKDRLRLIKRVISEGFRMKIWGPVLCEWKDVGPEVKDAHTRMGAVNEEHSRVCQSSLINLGIDQDRDLDMGHSARLYRVMCAGGLYLLNATKGVDKLFKVNKDGDAITGDEDLVFYYSDDDLINKLDFLLEHDDIRKSIAKNGQEKVLKEHTFKNRIEEMIKLIE